MSRKISTRLKYINCTNNQALAASPSGLYLAAATAETITLYLVSTGAVVGVVTRHYQPITVLAWTADSSHWLSGGEDGQVRHFIGSVEKTTTQHRFEISKERVWFPDGHFFKLFCLSFQ